VIKKTAQLITNFYDKIKKAESARQTLMDHKTHNTYPKSITATLAFSKPSDALKQTMVDTIDNWRKQALDEAIKARTDSIDKLNLEYKTMADKVISTQVGYLANRIAPSHQYNITLFTRLFSDALQHEVNLMCTLCDMRATAALEARKKKVEQEDKDDEMKTGAINEESISLLVKRLIQKQLPHAVTTAVGKQQSTKQTGKQQQQQKSSVKKPATKKKKKEVKSNKQDQPKPASKKKKPPQQTKKGKKQSHQSSSPSNT
jgi:hypothetical protein